MKSLFIFLWLMIASIAVNAQNKNISPQKKQVDSVNKEIVSAKLKQQQEQKSNIVRQDRAKKMGQTLADSLGLSESQRADITNINVGLELQKAQAFKGSTDRNVVGAELQRIEKQRDMMYKTVLTEGQYQKYLLFKRKGVKPSPPSKK